MFNRLASLLILLALCVAASVQAQETEQKPLDEPLRLGIVVDCSGSQRLQLDRTVAIAKQIVESLGEADEAFVMRFVDSQKMSIVQGFTSDKGDLEDAVDSLYIEGGQTSLIDAVYFSSRYFAKARSAATGGTRAVVLISDGDDRDSSRKMDEVVAILKAEKIRVFAIGISDLKVNAKLLEKFSRETGGKTYIPRTAAEISNAVLDFAKNVRGEPAISK